MGLGAIAVSEILAYGRAFGFTDLDELLSRVRAADAVFLDWHGTRKAAGPDTAAAAAEKFGIQLPEG